MSNTNVSNLSSNGYYLDDVSQAFEEHAAQLIDELGTAEKNMTGDASNPAFLATYQSKLQEYTLFRNAQTSTVKAYKDIGAAIIQNFR